MKFYCTRKNRSSHWYTIGQVGKRAGQEGIEQDRTGQDRTGRDETGRDGTGRDDTMPSIFVPNSYLSGNLRKRRDGTTKCRRSSSLISTCRATLENDGTGRQNVVHPGLLFLPVGQFWKMTGRDDKISSVLVLAQDGRTAPLRTLFTTLSRPFQAARMRGVRP